MTHSIAAEQIYDAAFDDDLFANLPAALNRAYGARSCTLHWWHEVGAAEVMAHSGYFSDEDMLNYAANFTQTDLWSLEALQLSRANRVWNCDDLVPPDTYENSVFYNDWIRAMGDDTFHCIGIAMRTQWGVGFVGLHRGKSQGPFSGANVRALAADIRHLRRMLTMRTRFMLADGQARSLAGLVDTLGQAVFLVDAEGRVRHLNQAAEAMLKDCPALHIHSAVLCARERSDDARLKQAIAKVLSSEAPEASAVAISDRSGCRWNLSIVATPPAAGRRLALVTAAAPDRCDPSVKERLRILYGLSSAEARLAVMLAEGAGPAEIAEERGVALGTVRVQIKAIAAKLGCHRQADIVRVVRSLPPLRPAISGLD